VIEQEDAAVVEVAVVVPAYNEGATIRGVIDALDREQEDAAVVEVAVVVPAYNEGATIRGVIDALDRAVTSSREIVVVYDVDGDDTVPVVKTMLGAVAGLRLHKNHRGRGALEAIRSGVEATSARYVVVSMADGSDRATDIEPMVELARDGAAVVAASRYMPGGRQLGGPMLKVALSRAAGLALHAVGLPIHDCTSNFRLYSRELLDSVEIESWGGFELALELTVKAYAMGHALAEVPTVWSDREHGQSRFALRKWLPLYLHWFLFGLRACWRRRTGRSATLEHRLGVPCR
jgi:glycosyltransferase involved in cell wall biosynthesis